VALGVTTLEELRQLIGDCHRCPLGETRTTLVFGVGRPDADVMFIGEAPGRNEDLKGEPFVGAAGKLLDELLASAGLSRADVYIANILKCRPPGNRNPQAAEIETCTPFLREQVQLISPRVIVTLGNFATRFVLKTTAGITGLRGTLHTTGRFTVLPIFHPAAALYDATKRDVLFADFAVLKGLLASPEPEPGRTGPTGDESVQPSLFGG
jgi:DNA polymerase